MKLKYLLEEYKDSVKVPWRNNAVFSIFKNPTQKELKILRMENEEVKEKGFRVIINLTKKEVFFASNAIIHSFMAEKIGYESNYSEFESIIFPNILYISVDDDKIFRTYDSMQINKKNLNIINELIKNVELNKSFIQKWVDYDSLIYFFNTMVKKRINYYNKISALKKDKK